MHTLVTMVITEDIVTMLDIITLEVIMETVATVVVMNSDLGYNIGHELSAGLPVYSPRSLLSTLHLMVKVGVAMTHARCNPTLAFISSSYLLIQVKFLWG